MKTLFYLSAFILLFTNCTHRIVRNNYQLDQAHSDTCEVVIKNNFMVDNNAAKKVGEIKLKESGFAVACSEKHAVTILKDEACAIDADMIVITAEKRPDLWSTCYRCDAEFYKFDPPPYYEKYKSDDWYKPDNIEKRVSRDRWKNTFMAIGGGAAGFLIGFMLFSF